MGARSSLYLCSTKEDSNTEGQPRASEEDNRLRGADLVVRASRDETNKATVRTVIMQCMRAAVVRLGVLPVYRTRTTVRVLQYVAATANKLFSADNCQRVS